MQLRDIGIQRWEKSFAWRKKNNKTDCSAINRN